MRNKTLIAAIAAGFALGALCAAPAWAAEVTFSLKEKAVIVDFYGGAGGGNQDKGKGKNKGQGVGSQGLPPGLAKKGKLPPGIAKRNLPATLVSQLPPPPKGFERVIVDNDVLLVEIATQIVHDVLTDIVRKK